MVLLAYVPNKHLREKQHQVYKITHRKTEKEGILSTSFYDGSITSKDAKLYSQSGKQHGSILSQTYLKYDLRIPLLGTTKMEES
jgi:hypothetical protein